MNIEANKNSPFTDEDYTFTVRLKIFLKKLRDMRYLGLVYTVLGVIIALMAILSLTLYGLDESYILGIGLSNEENPFVGMIFFFSVVLTILTSILSIYFSSAYYFTREKKNITLTAPIMLAVSAFFALIHAIVSIVYLTSINGVLKSNSIDHSINLTAWILYFIFTFLVIILTVPFVIFFFKNIDHMHLSTLKNVVVNKDFVSDEERIQAKQFYNRYDKFALAAIILTVVSVIGVLVGWLPQFGFIGGGVALISAIAAFVLLNYARKHESEKLLNYQHLCYLLSSILIIVSVLMIVLCINFTIAYPEFYVVEEAPTSVSSAISSVIPPTPDSSSLTA